VSIAPAVAPDLPLSAPLPELLALLVDVADASAFAEPPAPAEALALLSECEELSDFALASLLLPALLEELDALADLPPPVAASELPAEPAAF